MNEKATPSQIQRAHMTGAYLAYKIDAFDRMGKGAFETPMDPSILQKIFGDDYKIIEIEHPNNIIEERVVRPTTFQFFYGPIPK